MKIEDLAVGMRVEYSGEPWTVLRIRPKANCPVRIEADEDGCISDLIPAQVDQLKPISN